MIKDAERRRRLADLLGDIVDRLAAKHVARHTQEAPMTAKIGQALEDADAAIREAVETGLEKGRRFAPYDIKVTVQDIPDRGKGSLEKASGIDLYVNITVRTGERSESKGFIIQAKKRRRRDGLVEQCDKMLERTKTGAYAWIYEPDGCWVIKAQAVKNNPGSALSGLPRRTSGDVFDAILECLEGDKNLGLPSDIDEDEALDDMMDQLRAPAGVSFEVTKQAIPDRPTISLRFRRR